MLDGIDRKIPEENNDPNLNLPFSDPSFQQQKEALAPQEKTVVVAKPKKAKAAATKSQKRDSFFGPEKKSIFFEIEKKPSSFKKLAFYSGLLVAFCLLSYLLLNYPSIYHKIAYFLKGKQAGVVADLAQNKDMPIVKDTVQNEGVGESKWPGGTVSADQNLGNSLFDNHLYIPKIEVVSPIIWQVPEDQMVGKLREGVVHYKNTALPGTEGGNVFITGHSSYYSFDPGKFKTIFALLDRLEKGDSIYITYQNKKYEYRVFDKINVSPKDTSVLYPSGKTMVSLMTCVPVGTTWRRIIVKAEQVSVTEGKASSSAGKPTLENGLELLPSPSQ